MDGKGRIEKMEMMPLDITTMPILKYRITLKACAKGYDGESDAGHVSSYEETCK